ncbi:MAG: phosphoenolpyruvate--protein phosphotransferase [Rhodobiaceae bacterium]|nr:phosphoenolpyruvate--protein phosphotransferase [Rhodobiaceae bacterium]
MRGSNPGPWIMLRRLREVMAEPIVAQDRLNKIVILIAGNMVAEVCSVYVMREHGVLELFATQGLKQEAVHTSKLRLGKGLVGLIAEQAEPLNLPNAQQHPSFAYLPETGEEIYQSFLGVPILRGGHTLGVLVVQNRAKRTYSEEEVEALQTTAMVIAELFASGELDVDAAPDIDIRHLRPHHLRGMPLSDGLGLGHAVFHEPRIVVRNLIAEDVEYEQKRLVDALGRLRASIDSMLSRRDMAGAGEHREVLDAYRMFAHDRGWSKRLREAVVTGLTAEAAVERVQNDYRARMMRQTDRYIRERLHDLDDLGNRLQRELLGLPNGPRTDLPKDAVIVARNMGPAELLDYDRERIRGLVLEEGGATSHVSIVAKALGIATVGQVANVLDMIDESDPIIVDGQTGDVHIRPQADVESAYVEKVRFRARRHAQYQKIRDLPAISRDGVKIDLFINSGLLVDLPHLRESGADGIGLFRTELQFMLATNLPRARDQERVYAQVLDIAGNRPVTFRSLDVGGDKVLPYLRSPMEENPALGWRAIRLSLDRPGLLRTQARALMRAAAGRELRLMFPMVSDVAEFRLARDVIEREKAYLSHHGYVLPETVRLGAMVEVPAILFELDKLVREVDFLSVGSNDLIQFMFAADRANPRLNARFDTLSGSVLRALQSIVETARGSNVPVTLCGEMASHPLDALALLGIGFRGISMTPAAVAPIKAMVRETDIGALAADIAVMLAGQSSSIREPLADYARMNGIPV